MPSNLLTQIRKTQARRLQVISGTEPLPEHNPEMLYIGCVDARLDPVKDIGIPQGDALIYRNIGALVPPPYAQHEGLSPESESVGALVPPPYAQHKGLSPESESVGAVLEFFLKMPAIMDETGNKKVKHIVVSGHTHCGGVHYACEHNLRGAPGDWFLPRYLSMLAGAVRKVFGMENPPDVKSEKDMREVERASVRQSFDNLMEYDVVKEALKAGKIELHGWVLDTKTKQIEEMEKTRDGKSTPIFKLMGGKQPEKGR